MPALEQSYWPANTTVPVLEATVGSLLRAAGADAPGAVAVVEGGPSRGARRTWTYAELLRDATLVARALLARFEPGERCAIYAPNCAEWLLLELGASLAGIVLVTVNPASRARELRYVVAQSRCVGLFHAHYARGNPLVQHVAAVRDSLAAVREWIPLNAWTEFLAGAHDDTSLPDVEPQHAAQIQYTSGTTGSPKGALLHHRGLVNNARFFADRADVRRGDVYVHAMPFFHTAGCVLATLGCLHARATHAFLQGYDPGRLLDLLEDEGGTHLLGVPTMLIGLLDHFEVARRDLRRLRVVTCGGASVPPQTVRSMEQRLGVELGIVYGQTEASPLITQVLLSDSPEDKAHTVGPPLPQTEVKIIDPTSGETQPIGAVGELCTRGYHVMHGYFDNPEATSAAIDREGWLHSGDLASMDLRGYCRITGRLKDMVIRGGENLFPAEIEAALHEHPAVANIAVVGVPDPAMGEELAAFVKLRSAATAQELHAHVRARLAAQKAPRYWVVVEDFPLTGSGKVQKFVLRERWAAGGLVIADVRAGGNRARSGP